jgi:Electron transfer DM13
MVQDSLLYAGVFHSVSAMSSGEAEVHLTAGARLLRFTSDFATEINPDVEVWLVAADSAADNQTVLNSAHLSLGSLKSGMGAQSYGVPDSVDFGVYRSVTVWCVKAQVLFATAALTPR